MLQFTFLLITNKFCPRHRTNEHCQTDVYLQRLLSHCIYCLAQDSQYVYHETTIRLKVTYWTCLKCIELAGQPLEVLIIHRYHQLLIAKWYIGLLQDQMDHKGLATIILPQQTITACVDNLVCDAGEERWIGESRGEGLIDNCLLLAHSPCSDAIWHYYKCYLPHTDALYE